MQASTCGGDGGGGGSGGGGYWQPVLTFDFGPARNGAEEPFVAHVSVVRARAFGCRLSILMLRLRPLRPSCFGPIPNMLKVQQSMRLKAQWWRL